MGCKEVMGRENIQMPTCTHLRNFPFCALPPSLLFFIQQTLIYHISLRQILLHFSLFPFFHLREM